MSGQADTNAYAAMGTGQEEKACSVGDQIEIDGRLAWKERHACLLGVTLATRTENWIQADVLASFPPWAGPESDHMEALIDASELTRRPKWM